MKVKPKEVMVNLPVALLFDEPWEIISFAANINTILHGKVKLKVEELGVLGGRHVGIFYLDRNVEYHEIRDEFMRLIEQEEYVAHTNTAYVPSENELADQYDPNYGDNNECLCGHPYYRHFDTYDDMAAIGCKYCHYDSPNGKHLYERYCPGFKAALKTSTTEDVEKEVFGGPQVEETPVVKPALPKEEEKSVKQEYCRQVPECGCGCRAIEFGVYPEGFKP